MNAVSEFFKRHFEGHECDCCNRFMPNSALVNLYAGFKEIDGKYCVQCFHKMYDLMGVCDECGNEYPTTRLYKNVFDDQVLCEVCVKDE